MAIPAIGPIGGGIDAISLYRAQPGLAAPAGAGPADAAGGASFASLIAGKLGGAISLEQQGSQAAQALATGAATDISAATVAVEKAAIAEQLVGAFRNKAIEAYQDVMRMQI